MILTEHEQTLLVTWEAAGRACAAPARPCLKPAQLRVALTGAYSNGVPVTHLLKLCIDHARSAENVRDHTVVHAAWLDEIEEN